MCALAANGAEVVGLARTFDLARAACRTAGMSATPMVCDLANPAPVAAAAHEIRRIPGQWDAVIANAPNAYRPILRASHGIEEGFLVDYGAHFVLVNSLVGVVRDGTGRIVIVSSSAGEFGVAAQPAYCASRNGLLGLMRAVAQDVGPYGVTCNAVLPGWTKTPMADDLVRQMAAAKGRSFDETWAEAVAAYPAQRPLDPQEIADTVAFLASDAASGINGETVKIALGGVW